jgi:hypothetical protein
MRKRWLLQLPVLMSLAVPALSQTIDEQQGRVLREAYESFFNVTYRLIQSDVSEFDLFRQRHGEPPPEIRRHLSQRDPENADDWLMERRFRSSDTERIVNAVSQWYTDRQVVLDAWTTCGKTTEQLPCLTGISATVGQNLNGRRSKARKAA